MAYNTKNLITDAGTKQIPQFFDTAADNYYVLLGTDGAGPHYVNFDTSGDELFTAANPGNVQVRGSTVVIGATTYQVTDGAVLRGTDAIKPTAALAHAAIPYCYYFAIDTGVVEATDGTNWVVI